MTIVTNLEKPFKKHDSHQLVLRVFLPDNEGQGDCGREFMVAVGLGKVGLPRREKNGTYLIVHYSIHSILPR